MDNLKGRYTQRYEEMLSGMGFDLQKQRAPHNEQLWQLAVAEVDVAVAGEERELLSRLWGSPLAPQVQAIVDAQSMAEAMQAELNQQRDALKAQIKALQAQIEELEDACYEAMPNPRELVKAYETARAQLLRERVADADLRVCDSCRQAKPDTELVFVDRRYVGSITDCMSRREWFERRRELHHWCGDCQRERAEAERALSIDYGTRGSTFCHVYPTRDQAGVLWYDGPMQSDDDDGWQPVPEDVTPAPVLESAHLDVERALGVPGQLDIPYHDQFRDRLVIKRGWREGNDVPVVPLA